LSFASKAVQEPDLRLSFIAGGQEGQPFSVGAPASVRGADAFAGEGDGFAARRCDHPDARFALVFFHVRRGDGVGDPAGIGTDLWVVDLADLEVICDGDRARGRGRLLGDGGHREQAQNYQSEQENPVHG